MLLDRRVVGIVERCIWVSVENVLVLVFDANLWNIRLRIVLGTRSGSSFRAEGRSTSEGWTTVFERTWARQRW